MFRFGNMNGSVICCRGEPASGDGRMVGKQAQRGGACGGSTAAPDA